MTYGSTINAEQSLDEVRELYKFYLIWSYLKVVNLIKLPSLLLDVYWVTNLW